MNNEYRYSTSGQWVKLKVRYLIIVLTCKIYPIY